MNIVRADAGPIRYDGGVVPSAYAMARALDRVAFAGLCAFVFTIPWEESVPLLGGFVVSRWFALLTLGALLLRISMTARFRRLSALHAAMLSLVAWAALSIFWTMDRESTLVRAGTYTQLLAAVWMIWELALTEWRVAALLRSYVLGTFVLSARTMLNFIGGREAADVWAEQGLSKWHDARYTVVGVNENDLGLMLALSLPMTLYLLTRRNRPLVTLFYWIQLGVSLTTIFLSGSRGALISAGIGMAMLPVVLSYLPRQQRLASAAVCVVGLGCGVYFVPQVNWQRLIALGGELFHGTLSHRTQLWSAGLAAYRDHPFTGVGAGAYGVAVVRAVDLPFVAHNTFLSVLVELGPAGILMLGGILAGLFWCAWQMPRLEKRLWIVLLSTWAAGVFALTWEYRKPTWFLFGLLAAHAHLRGRTRPTPGWNSHFPTL
jgi:O-antigen ligase